MGKLEVPYLSLSVSQAAELPEPSHPEPSNHSTFTSLLQHRATHQAEQIAVGFPHSKGKQEHSTYTFGQLRTQSLLLAHQLRVEISPCCVDGVQPVVALLGPSGPVFLLHALASWHLGAAVLPIAIGTTPKGAASLLEKCKCDALLFSRTQAGHVEDIRQLLKADKPPLVLEWKDLECADVDNTSSVVEALYQVGPEDNLVIFHSSGSSGSPKPLAQCHGFWSRSLVTAPRRDKAAYTTTPLYHGGLSDLFRSVQASASLYFFPWHLSTAPTVDSITQSVEACQEHIAYFLSVPFILDMLIGSTEGSSLLQAMDMVSTGGAPLSEQVGDRATKEMNIKLVSRLGSSECGFLMSSYRDFDRDKDWSWLRVPDELGQRWLRFEPSPDQASDVYELVVSSSWPTKQLSNRRDGSFATGDLYERHPLHANQWRYKRRNDDAIVMVNGKKIAASLVEEALCSSPLIEDAIVFGSNRALLGAVIFSPQSGSTSAYPQELKAFLQEVNRSLPSHGRVAFEMVHIGDAALRSSLPRSSKGTLQKGLALDAMAALIDNMYWRFEEGEAPRTEAKKSLSGRELTLWLKTLVEDVRDGSIGENDDFYGSGIDSIMAAMIRAGIHQRLELQGFRLKSKDIYDHPTVALLSRFIDGRGRDGEQERSTVMLDMVMRHSSFAPVRAKDDAHRSGGNRTVLLTGATGALGSRILYELLQGTGRVDSVVCLVRAIDAMAARGRVKTALEERNLSLPDQKIDCVTTLFELSMKKSVINATSLFVIHSAWIVNFALRVESFEEDCIAGLHDLLDFFRSCPNAARFIFCSSLASVMGYGNSKWVAEKVCHEAGSNVVVARIGQLCGDSKHGIWNTTEAWPLLIRTAQEVGVLPSSGPDIDWLPVDVAAKAIVELTSVASVPSRYFHVALPPDVRRPSWETYLHWLEESGLSFMPTSKDQWLQRVQDKRAQVRGSALIDIWAGVSMQYPKHLEPRSEVVPTSQIPDHSSEESANVDMTQAMTLLSSLSKANAVNEELCKKMVKAWRESGFLQ